MTSKVSLTQSDKHVREVEAYRDIAREDGALMSLRELIGLAWLEANEAELEDALRSDPGLSARYVVEPGYVLEQAPCGESSTRVALEENRKERARADLATATRSGWFLAGGALLVGVGGGSSYLKAGGGTEYGRIVDLVRARSASGG